MDVVETGWTEQHGRGDFRTVRTKNSVPRHMEVVFVAHIPASAIASAGGAAAVREGFDSEELELVRQVEETLGPLHFKWHFQTQKRRDCA